MDRAPVAKVAGKPSPLTVVLGNVEDRVERRERDGMLTGPLSLAIEIRSSSAR